MIRIELIMKNSEIIELIDNSECSDELLDNLSLLMKSNKINILKTDTNSLLVRPNSVEAIRISYIKEIVDENKNILEQNKKEEEMDIITDAD